MNVLKDCFHNLMSGFIPSISSVVELYDEAERRRVAYIGLKTFHRRFVNMGPKYEKFRRRVEGNVLRFQEKPDFGLIREGVCIRVTTIEDLDRALSEGYEFNPHSLNGRFGQDHEILPDTARRRNFAELYGVEIGGSPYPMHLHHAQLRMVVRGVYRWLYVCNVDSVIVEALAHIKISKSVMAKLGGQVVGNIGRELLHAFYNEKRVPQYWMLLRQMREHLRGANNLKLYAEGVACFLIDALGTCKPMPAAWKTDTVIGLCRTMRESEDFSIMPILADALQDAGCDSDELLTHYRNPAARFSLGSWVFRSTGAI